MRILSIENFPGTHLGRMMHVLNARDVEVETFSPYLGENLPEDDRDYDAVIVLGGAQDALDDENHPYFPDLIDLMKAFDRAGKHVLGICLGAQLIARGYGGENLVGFGLEFGYHPIRPAGDSKADPLFSDLGLPKHLFEWHFDSMTMPPDGVLLASTDFAPVQAFRMGQTVYAIQFHVEVVREQIDLWTTDAAKNLDDTAGNWRETLNAGLEQHYELALEFCDRFTSRWLDLVQANRLTAG